MRGMVEGAKKSGHFRFSKAVTAKTIAGATVVVSMIVYSINHPGEITFDEILSPTFQSSTEVSGQINRPAVRRIALEVNGQVTRVDVVDGRFSTSIPLVLGENKVRPFAVDAGISVAHLSEPLTIDRKPVRVVFVRLSNNLLAHSHRTLAYAGSEIAVIPSVDSNELSDLSAVISGSTDRRQSGQVSVKFEGSERTVTTDQDGNFDFQVELSPGKNTIELAEGYVGDPLTISVPSVVLTHDFENGDHGWRLRQGKLVSTPKRQASDASGNAFLSFSDGTLSPLDIVFVYDSSASMGASFGPLKEKAIEFFQKLESANGDVRLGIVRFANGADIVRELDDSKPWTGMSTVVRIIDHGIDGKPAPTDVNRYTCQDQYLGLRLALEMNWREDATRAIVLITDDQAAIDSFERQKTGQTFTADQLNSDSIRRDASKNQIELFPIIVQHFGDTEGEMQANERLFERAVKSVEELGRSAMGNLARSSKAAVFDNATNQINLAREARGLGMWQAPDIVVQTLRSTPRPQVLFRLRCAGDSSDELLVTNEDLVARSANKDWSLSFSKPMPAPHQWHTMFFDFANLESEELLRELIELRIRAEYQVPGDDSGFDDFTIIQSFE